MAIRTAVQLEPATTNVLLEVLLPMPVPPVVGVLAVHCQLQCDIAPRSAAVPQCTASHCMPVAAGLLILVVVVVLLVVDDKILVLQYYYIAAPGAGPGGSLMAWHGSLMAESA